MSKTLLVIDMLVGFLEPGRPLYVGDEAVKIISRVEQLIVQEKTKGTTILFVGDSHDVGDLEFQMFPEHCIKGTEEANVIDRLVPYVDSIVTKRRYSAFFDTDLDDRLKKSGTQELMLAGVCTDICVMHTAADARNRDLAVEVVSGAVASFDQGAHKYALHHMGTILGVTVKDE
jgi:nicotinamidase-related amidase